jgi:hypothetical protein
MVIPRLVGALRPSPMVLRIRLLRAITSSPGDHIAVEEAEEAGEAGEVEEAEEGVKIEAIGKALGQSQTTEVRKIVGMNSGDQIISMSILPS